MPESSDPIIIHVHAEEDGVFEPTPEAGGADTDIEHGVDMSKPSRGDAAMDFDMAPASVDTLADEVRVDALGESDGVPVNVPEAAPIEAPVEAHPYTVVTFDKAGNVLAGPINAAQTAVDWGKSNAEGVVLLVGADFVVDPTPYRMIAGAVAIGVYNLVTGDADIFPLGSGAVSAAVMREWHTLAKTLPEVPPLHPDPAEFRAQLEADAAAVPQVTAPEVAAQHVVPEPSTWCDETVAVAPLLAPRTPNQHADAAFQHWNRLCADDPMTIDIAAVAQGVAIAVETARARRHKYPHSTPQAVVSAVEGLGRTFRDLRRLLACYHHLAHAAAGGVDVGEALAALNAFVEPLIPEL